VLLFEEFYADERVFSSAEEEESGATPSSVAHYLLVPRRLRSSLSP
jgi:hypothetical protein